MRATGIVVRKRLTVLLFLLGTAFFFLAVRLAFIQFIQGEALKQRAMEVRTRDIPVEAKRGTIYDRNGKELVVSVSADSVYAIPRLVENVHQTAQQLAAVLQMDAAKIERILTRRSSFEWIKRKIDPETAAQIKALHLKGIHLVEESRRHYIYSTLAPHVLGFTGVDNQGLMGIEKSYEQFLRGEDGRIIVEHDAAGREVPEPINRYLPPRQGNNVYLTIDETIQHFVERELDRIVARYQPRMAVILVMNPSTGEILAMGNRPTFDANRWQESPQEIWDRNPAIWYNYEPGSTFKIITAAAALEEKVVQPGDRFYDPGFIKIADRRIKCWRTEGHGSQTFAEVVQNSCNPGFIEVGLRLGKERFYQYLERFGFGQRTGIALPGEAAGIVIPQDKATNLNLATMAIGQSIAVTPIQLLTAVSAVANGGVLMQPQIVREICTPDGQVVQSFTPRPVRRVISEETSRQLLQLLEQVVLRGTGKNAYVEGYRVAGKTGTAQVVGEKGGYVPGKYVSSFVGFAPVEAPQVAVLVMVAEPQGGIYYGSQVAAPVFQAVVGDILRYLQYPANPDLPRPEKSSEASEKKENIAVPGVVYYPLSEAEKIMRACGLAFRTVGEGYMVYGQTPQEGAMVPAGTTVILDLNLPPELTGSGQVIVPFLQSLTVTEVSRILYQLGLQLEANGHGLAVKQEPPPGTRVPRGSTIKVEFKPPGQNSGEKPLRPTSTVGELIPD